MTPQDIIPWQVNLLYTGVSNPSESVFFPKILITRGNLNQNQKYFKPFWGSPKADSNNEKNESRKSRLTVPVGGVITLVQQPYLFFYYSCNDDSNHMTESTLPKKLH